MDFGKNITIRRLFEDERPAALDLKGYAVLMRVLGAVFALIGGMLIKWAVK